MYIHRLIKRFVFLNGFETGGGGGGAIDTPSPAPVDPSSAPVDPAPAPSTPVQTSMLEAIEQGLSQNNSGQPRDEFGRFAPRQPGDPQQTQVAPQDQQPTDQAKQAPKPEDKPAAETPDDLLKEPEGLTPKGSERFQKLANTVKEQQRQIEQRDQALAEVRETFQSHGISREQFHQAAEVIGALNRGDFDAAERVLMEQLQQIAIARGRPVGQIDALAEFPDLRQQVDQLMLTEEHALQLARGRVMERNSQQQLQAQQREHQEQQRQAQQQQQIQQERQTALQGIDAFTAEMASKDMDWPVIEAKLLPRIQTLLQGVPPSQWLNVVKTQYELIKDVSSGARQQQQTTVGQVLRPTGQGSPAAAPKSMFDAMWGGR